MRTPAEILIETLQLQRKRDELAARFAEVLQWPTDYKKLKELDRIETELKLLVDRLMEIAIESREHRLAREAKEGKKGDNNNFDFIE